MGMTAQDQAFFDGYESTRATCLTIGVEVARRLIQARNQRDSAWLVGAELAVWDYEDANGLPHTGCRAAGSAGAA